jgi:hypothetical protein
MANGQAPAIAAGAGVHHSVPNRVGHYVAGPFDRALLSIFTIFFFCLLIAPPTASLAIMLQTRFFTESEPQWVLTLGWLIFSFRGFPSEVAILITQAVPALLTALCYRTYSQRILNAFGWIILLVLASGVLAASVVLAYIDPTSVQLCENITGGCDRLSRMTELARGSLQQCVTYIVLLLGLHAVSEGNKS